MKRPFFTAAWIALAGAGGACGGPEPEPPGLALNLDLDANGLADIVVGDARDDESGLDAGRALVWLRRADGPSYLAAVLEGRAAGDLFGASVAMAGDVNGDGQGDLIVGAYRHFAGDVDAGEAYLFLGGPGPGFDAEPDGLLTGPACQELGISVAGAGDLNGDGLGDLVIGGRGNGAGAAGVGRAFVVLGAAGAAVDLTPSVVLSTGVVGDHFGAEVAGVGDVGGDGYDDLVVCAPVIPNWARRDDGLGEGAGGLAYVFDGGPGGPGLLAAETISVADAAARFAGTCQAFLP